MPCSDKEKALRLLKQYRERLTGIGDVHYLEEVAFLIHAVESPVFEQLLRMGSVAQTPTCKAQPSHTKPSSEASHGENKANKDVVNCTAVLNGASHDSLTDKDRSILASSHNSNTPVSVGAASQAGRLTNHISGGTTASAGVSNDTSGHLPTIPSYSFYLMSGSSQLSNDSWGSIDLPMGNEKPLDFEDYHMQSLAARTGSGPAKKLSVSNSSAAALSPLSQIPSSNKSSSSSVSVKSIVTLSDSNKGPPSDTALVGSSSSQELSVGKGTAKKKERNLTVTLHKGKEGLGFSVVGLATEHKGDLGIYIQEIQKGGLAEKSGKLFKGDQIVSINGRSLAGVSHDEAIKLLQKAKGLVELKLTRSSSPAGPPAGAKPINMTISDKDQCKWSRQIETIELKKEGKGFGFGIVSLKKGGVDICKIAEGSAAAKDGRLRVNDHLLQINNQNATNMSANDVMKILKGTKLSVRLVVARMVTEQPQPVKVIVANEPDAELEKFSVELVKDRNGLGITIAGLKKGDTDEEFEGIYVSSIAPDGPASHEGRIREGDQILQVNDTNLVGLENMAAAAVLRNTGQRVWLVLGRSRNQSSPDLTSSRTTDTQSLLSTAITTSKVEIASPDSNIVVDSDDSVYAKHLAAAEEDTIKRTWSEIVGKGYVIVVAQFAKSIPDTGLGIRVEGRVDLDDNQHPLEGGHHHIIELVREDGPVHKHGVLKQGDEILEVNGKSMINLEYNAAIQVIKATPHHVRIVAARQVDTSSSALSSPNSELVRDIIFKGPQLLKSYGENASLEGAPTSESEDDKRMQTPEKSKSSASVTPLSAMSDASAAADDFRWKSELARRRAERASWRKRHEVEKENLRRRIEKSRQDIQKQLREKEAEFNRMQEELEREQKSLQELQKEKLADCSGHSVYLSYKSYMEEFGSSPTWDQFVSNHRKQQAHLTVATAVCNGASPVDDIKMSDSELGFDTDTSESDVSSPDLPSPIPPSTSWRQTITDVMLYKGSRGLGFSILDFMDKDDSNVILICSIVPGGVADRNGELKVGDKLIAINDQGVVGKPLSDVVKMLTSIERGNVIITVAHKLGVGEDEKAFFGSMGGGSGEFPITKGEDSPEIPSVDQILAESLMADSQEGLPDYVLQRTAVKSNGDLEDDQNARNVMRLEVAKLTANASSDQPKTHKRLFELKETVNVTSTSSLHTPISRSSAGLAMSEQLRRSMPDLLDKLPNGHSGHHFDEVKEKRVNTLPHKRKSKIMSPTPSSTFIPLKFATPQSQQTSSVKNSLSLSTNSAFSPIALDNLVGSQAVMSVHRSDEMNGDPVQDNSNDTEVRPVRLAALAATVEMVTSTNGLTDSAASSFQHSNVQTTPTKQPGDHRHVLQPLQQPTISQPRTIVITRGNTGLGMSLACDAETDSVVVKTILSGSAVGRDGRIRIGDCIIAINGESLEGVTLSQAKGMLRTASLNPAGVTITYIPCPQGYVPTIAMSQYLPNDPSQVSNPTSPTGLEYGDHLIKQSSGHDFMVPDQLPVQDVSHGVRKFPGASHDPLLLPGYPIAPGSVEGPRLLQQNRLSYQSLGVNHKHLSNHPYSDSKVSYQPANPYSGYQVVQPSVYSLPTTPRADNLLPPPSYEVHMMTRQVSHGERPPQPVVKQPQRQQFAPAPTPTASSVTSVNYHMLEQSQPQQLPHPQQQQPHPLQQQPHTAQQPHLLQQQPHSHQQQQLYLTAAPPGYHRSSPVRLAAEVVQPGQFNHANYGADTHPVRLTDSQQQVSPPAYPLEPHPSSGDQQQSMYYLGAASNNSDYSGEVHYSQQLGPSPTHHDVAAANTAVLFQSTGANTAAVSTAAYQIPTTSHLVTVLPDSFSHSSQQKPPPPSYESHVRTSAHRQSRSQSPITTASMIPHQYSASDSLGKTSSSFIPSPSRLHQRDPATGVVSDASGSPAMVLRGQSIQGLYSPLLNKTDSKSRSGGDLHTAAVSDAGSSGKVLRNTSSGALKRFSGSDYLNKPPKYQDSSPKHVSTANDGSREEGSGPSVYEVELTKDANGSLGISILGCDSDKKRDEPLGGVFVSTISPPVKGKLKPGDKILEVNGKSLLQCTQQEAVEIICAAPSPVKLLMQCCYPRLRPRKRSSQQGVGEATQGSSSPVLVAATRRAVIHSWYIDEEEDPRLRNLFPNAEGHLFEVTLHRDGKKSLGMNLVPNEQSMTKGIIITVVQPGGVADSTGKVKPGDEILQVDDVLVMDLKQHEVVALLKKPTPLVHLVLVRPMAHLMGLHLQIPRGAHASVEQPLSPGQGVLPGHMISPHPFDQAVSDDSLDVTALTATKSINLVRDSNQGLGFSVMEEEVNRRMVVMVKDVVTGGPAYQEGQLHIGDILLSVDGKSVVGKPYNMALQLLQQSKVKGSALLVFAPGSLNGTGPGDSPIKETSPLMSSLPLTAQQSPTRDTSKQQPEANSEQRSGSRRSSAAERGYDTRVIRSSRKKSSKKSSLERKQMKKSESNRQSSVDELERNMEQLQQKNKLELSITDRDAKDDATASYEEFEVEVSKGSGPLGLKVVGGADTTVKGVVIKEIVPNTQADIDGQLRPGDRILKVNSQNLKYSTHLEAMQALWNSGPYIKLCIQRKLSTTSDGNYSFSESLHSPCMEVEVIELVKPKQAGLGLIIGSREDRDGVFVDEVVVNGTAHKDGRIRPGDKILAINGQDVSASQQDLVAFQLQSCKGKISLTVGHAVGMSPVKDRSPDIGKYPLSIGPPVEIHRPPPSPPGYPGYNNNAGSMDSTHSSTSLQATPTVSHFNSDPVYHHDTYPLRYRSSSPPVQLPSQTSHVSHDPPPYPSGTNMQRIVSSGDSRPYLSQETPVHKEITLRRGSSSLGFTFVGGNEVPFYIKDIARDGVADKDGQLQRGDQLIAVNGVSIQGASYQYLLETLKKVHGEVKLMVISLT